MEQTDKKRKYNLLIAACALLYIFSIASKSVFMSASAALTGVFNCSDTEISLVNTYYFVTYGIVQVLLSFFIGKINVKIYLIITIPLSAVCCAAIALISNVQAAWIIFAINGIMQAGVWCCCILILSKYLPYKYLAKANTFLSVGMTVGNLLSTGSASFAIAINYWQIAFIFLGALLFASVVFFAMVIRLFKTENAAYISGGDNTEQDEEIPLYTLDSRKKVALFFIFACIVAFLSSCIYYALNNLLSFYIRDNFINDPTLFTLIPIFFPIVITVGPLIAINYCKKHKNYIKSLAFFIFFLIVFSAIMIFIYKINLILSLSIIAVIAVFCRASSTVYSGVAAFSIRSQINTGSYSALTNAFASLSAGISPTVTISIIKQFGWDYWFIIITTVAVVLLIFTVSLQVFTKKAQNF